MGSAPKHKRIVFIKPYWLKSQEEFRRQNKICENCPFK